MKSILGSLRSAMQLRPSGRFARRFGAADAARSGRRPTFLAVGLFPLALAQCPAPVDDDDGADRKLCQQTTAKCILVHQVDGKNHLELYSNRTLIDSIVVNTGPSGQRTRNTTTKYIYDETFNTESSETVTNASPGVDPKWWAPGVRQVYDYARTGLMGDPHKFDGGEAFHWRVQYSSEKDENGKSVPVLVGGLAQEHNAYSGGYAGNGCVHVPKWFIDKYDGTYFQTNVTVRVQDQPTS